MYKVFSNEKSIVLTDDLANYRSGYDTLFLKYVAKEGLSLALNLLDKSEGINQLTIYHANLDELWAEFKSLYQFVEAAGGVVSNEASETLFIRKRERWDLPKGKMDAGEKPETTALREVKEECGVNDLSVGNKLTSTYHIYEQTNVAFLKETHWYQMNSTFQGDLKGDDSEGITAVEWVGDDKMDQVLSDTYPAIRQLLQSL